MVKNPVYDGKGRIVYFVDKNNHKFTVLYNYGVYTEEFIDDNGIERFKTYDFNHNLISKAIVIKSTNEYGHSVHEIKEEKSMDELNLKDKEKLRIEVANLIATGHSYDEIYDALEHVKICSNLNQEAEKKGWNFICKERKLPIDYIRRNMNKVNWELVSAFQTLTEDEIREFADKVDWITIFLKYELSKEFLYEFQGAIRNALAQYMYDDH